MEYIITFKNTNFAMKGEKCLLEKNLSAGVIPLPAQIREGCGICLRVREKDISFALSALNEADINDNGLYLRVGEGNKYIYTEVSDRRF